MSEKTPKTERDRELRKREWLMIYLPLMLGVLLAMALIVMVSLLGFRSDNLGGDPASAGGDTAAIIVLIQAMVIGLIPLLMLIALVALFVWLFIKLQPVLKRGQEITVKISQKTDQVADSLVVNFNKPLVWGARLSVVKQFLRRSSDV